jgi:hypothetical protein
LRRERCFFVTHTPQGGFSCRFAAIHLLSRQKTIKIIARLRARNFLGLYGVVQKILAKVRSYERAFLFSAGRGWKREISLPARRRGLLLLAA